MPQEEATSAAPAAVLSAEQAAEMDGLILSCASKDACKVAVLIARVVDAAKARGGEAGAAVIAPRIYALAEAGKLAVTGNVRRWRSAEIKLGH